MAYGWNVTEPMLLWGSVPRSGEFLFLGLGWRFVMLLVTYIHGYGVGRVGECFSSLSFWFLDVDFAVDGLFQGRCGNGHMAA